MSRKIGHSVSNMDVGHRLTAFMRVYGSEHQATVVSTKPEIVYRSPPDLYFTCMVRHTVQVACWVRCFVVDGRVDDSIANGQCRNHRGNSPARPAQMADHALGAAYRHTVCMGAKGTADRSSLCGIT